MGLFSRKNPKAVERVTCERCKRSEKVDTAAASFWTITGNVGQALGYLCYSCQTPEERVEAHGEPDIFRSFDVPVGFLPNGTALTRVREFGAAVLAQDESQSVTYMCRRDALKRGRVLSQSDVLPLGFPGGQLSSWPEKDLSMMVDFAAFATSDGWDALWAVVVDIAERKGRSDSGQAKGPADS